MKYAVIRFGGKQFMVEEGDTVELTRQPDSTGVEVLYYVDGADVKVGTPTVSQVAVVLDKIEDKLGDKIRVTRFKSKSRYRKVKGHRQRLSVFEVKSIGVKKAKKSETKAAEEKIPKEITKPTKAAKVAAKPTKVAKVAAKTSTKPPRKAAKSTKEAAK
jgi:large subunit ribosomal protein L21